MVVIHPGVDQPPAGAEPARRGVARVLSVARLDDSYKGHDTLIRAMPLVRACVPEARARIVGDGRLRPYYERLAEGSGAADLVDFAGAISDFERDAEFRSASVFCLPVRAPRRRSRRGFRHRRSGSRLVRAPGDRRACRGRGRRRRRWRDRHPRRRPPRSRAARRALIRLLTDEPLRGDMSARGIAHSASFSWQRMAAAVEALCHEVLATRS